MFFYQVFNIRRLKCQYIYIHGVSCKWSSSGLGWTLRVWTRPSEGVERGKGKGGLRDLYASLLARLLWALPQLPGVRGDTQSVGPNMTITQGIAHSLLQHTTFVLQNKMQKYAWNIVVYRLQQSWISSAVTGPIAVLSMDPSRQYLLGLGKPQHLNGNEKSCHARLPTNGTRCRARFRY